MLSAIAYVTLSTGKRPFQDRAVPLQDLQRAVVLEPPVRFGHSLPL
jgi:hypothetical protein